MKRRVHSEWPTIINNHATRPRYGDCPGCGAAEGKWCLAGCVLLDPMDYR